MNDARALRVAGVVVLWSCPAWAVPLPTVAFDPVSTAGVLDGYVSQDMVVETITDWTTAVLAVNLTSGSIYTERFGLAEHAVG